MYSHFRLHFCRCRIFMECSLCASLLISKCVLILIQKGKIKYIFPINNHVPKKLSWRDILQFDVITLCLMYEIFFVVRKIQLQNLYQCNIYSTPFSITKDTHISFWSGKNLISITYARSAI